MFPERYSVFLGLCVQNRLAYQRPDEEGICVRNRVLSSLLLTLNRETYNLSGYHFLCITQLTCQKYKKLTDDNFIRIFN